jgi:hypothetical protein
VAFEAVMKAADLWDREDSASGRDPDWPMEGRVLV